MKTNDAAAQNALTMEDWYHIACQWEEEPEIYDPWQRNTDL